MPSPYYQQFAQTYDSGTYGQSAYQATSGADTAAASKGGSLSNTGIAVACIATLAALILLAALVVRIWKRPARQPSDQP